MKVVVAELLYAYCSRNRYLSMMTFFYWFVSHSLCVSLFISWATRYDGELLVGTGRSS